MASAIREIVVDAAPEAVWAAIGDFANGPLQTGPGLVTDCRLEEPDMRALTFADGTVARERLVARDEEARRIVWAWTGDEVDHDKTSMQVFAEGANQSRAAFTFFMVEGIGH
jgi:hypothetical protein